MREIKWVSIILLISTSCSRPYTLTASLNKSRWFGSGEATEIHTKENETCSIERFSLIIRTDLPFSKQSRNSTLNITGCVSPCTPTQLLGFYHIPLKKGTHNLALPDTCLPYKTAKSSDSFTVGGKASLHIMNTQTGSSKTYYPFSEGDKGWIKVTKLNRATGKIQGRFNITLTSSKGETLHFKRGKFNSKLITQ